MEDKLDEDQSVETCNFIEARRHEQIAYEYLCYLEESRRWIESCLQDVLPDPPQLEEHFRNGVFLARLGAVIAPEVVPLNKIYDVAQLRYKQTGLHFRHTDNINYFLRSLEHVDLPSTFYPETTDIYEKKNIPRLIYCLHALSLHLFKLGKAPQMPDLYGKVSFSNETISAVSSELQKFGIEMPAFRKIGGILANQLPVDEAALHAAIIAINEALDQGEADNTLTALQLPDARLESIDPGLAEDYHVHLTSCKQKKMASSRNRSVEMEDSYMPDVYDEMLTQAELQGNINQCNFQHSVQQLVAYVDGQHLEKILHLLQSKVFNLRDIDKKNVDWYFIVLEKLIGEKRNNVGHISISRDELQKSVVSANNFANREVRMIDAVEVINHLVLQDDPLETFKTLSSPEAMLPQGLKEWAAPLYHSELKQARLDKGCDLVHEELVRAVEVLRSVACVNQAIESGIEETLISSLLLPHCCLDNVEQSNVALYKESLTGAKQAKAFSENPFLTREDIQAVIDFCNHKSLREEAQAIAIGEINRAVCEGYSRDTFRALSNPAADLEGLLPENKDLYQYLLQSERSTKRASRADHEDLWLNEIRSCIAEANDLATRAYRLALKLTAINISLDRQDALEVYHYLTNPEFQIREVVRECKTLYLQRLLLFRRFKISEGGHMGTGWLFTRLPNSSHGFFFNVKDKRLLWFKTRDMVKDPTLLNRGEISAVVSAVNEEHNRQLMFQANEASVVKLQALVRGYLTRRWYVERIATFRANEAAVLKIQTWWRMARLRARHRRRVSELVRHVDKVVFLQSMVRMWLVRRRYKARLAFFKANEKAVIKIQSFWRSVKTRGGYRSLMTEKVPSFSTLLNLIHLLENSLTDYQEEMEIQTLKQKISDEIRRNQSLEIELKEMDTKIGLLVKNRISLEEVLKHNTKLKEYRRSEESNQAFNCGLKAMTKAAQKKLEAYQHLFYLLQTNPSYLGRLVHELPQNQQNKFVEKVIFSLYNFGANARDEYLLLKLFKEAVVLEITRNTNEPSDFLSHNPFVLRLIVGLSRSPHAIQSLRNLLQASILAILHDPQMVINTSPVDVYKHWINSTEATNGAACGLPYDVTAAEALQHPEVLRIVKANVEKLRYATQRFLKAIFRSPDKLPYTIRYCGRVIKASLHERYPHHPEKEILKVIANMVYYRFLNTAIIAPDSCDIIDPSQEGSVSNEKRRTLGCIAKMLQFVASNKGFGNDSPLLAVLNPFIRDSHEQFKQYLLMVCNVEDAESYFGIDQYTDQTLLTRPTIQISLKEILDTHLLLLQYQDIVAPEHHDPLHDVLEELGESNMAASLFGGPSLSESFDPSKRLHQRSEISLTLGPRADLAAPVDDSDLNEEMLFLRTKRLVVDILQCQRGTDLPTVLHSKPKPQDEHRHKELLKSREQLNESLSHVNRRRLNRCASALSEMKLPLEEKKRQVEANLQHLERKGLVRTKDNYQSVVSAIVRDIRNLRGYRQRRKQDLVRLKNTLQRLLVRRQFQEDQIDSYSRYCACCMQNIVKRKKGVPARQALGGDMENHVGGRVIRFTAADLHKKGVVLEIEGLSNSQFKNLQFEISESEERAGLFVVIAKFMGVIMDKVELVFEDLLQLQYEGVAVMRLFNRAKVNVNLLIFLINKKFYSK